jgi:hypothetical protein
MQTDSRRVFLSDLLAALAALKSQVTDRYIDPAFERAMRREFNTLKMVHQELGGNERELPKTSLGHTLLADRILSQNLHKEEQSLIDSLPTELKGVTTSSLQRIADLWRG